ncbi:type II secretion system minor pseudopilin GspI [Saccharospirillum sp. MSK14-1]|uniref:type II secretion system minor pseudopilin GspI n=1 Tax=Saccharospirillum sp. MSK14-1 TaxID=1897632 RepID=UPI001304AA68|nr:type II secretion system minor pseudopilin GspI [Saccharospirillum sp. MSK14-1]
MSRSEAGFTLLEVMVALAVFAVMAGAIALANTQNLAAARQIEEQSDARWVNQNILSQLRFSALPDAGDRLTRDARFNGRDWEVEVSVAPFSFPGLPAVEPYLRQVELSARLVNEPADAPPADRLTAVLAAP